MRKALITGGAGYIGHHLQKELKRHNFTVIVVDKKPQEELMSDKYLDLYIQGDLTDDAFVDSIPKMEIDYVFHLAGLIEVGEAEAEPIRYYQNNLISTINVLKLMKKIKCNKIVFSSSAAVYGRYYDEDPVSVYGRTKLMCENIIRDAEAEGIRSVSLRYFNVAGADPSGEFGENHRPETHLIPRLLTLSDFHINGDDYSTPDGTCVRDYIHVSDLAVAHIKAAWYLGHSTGVSRHFNVGSGSGYSILQIISALNEFYDSIGHKPVSYSVGPRRPGDPASLVAEVSRAKQFLDFVPNYGIEDIIATAYQWEVVQQRSPKNE